MSQLSSETVEVTPIEVVPWLFLPGSAPWLWRSLLLQLLEHAQVLSLESLDLLALLLILLD